jgi:hypothetical protein
MAISGASGPIGFALVPALQAAWPVLTSNIDSALARILER